MSDTINYGIDLGTTNSAIAKCEGDAVRVFKNRDQMDVTPSVVRIEKTGRIIVGRRAYQTLFSDTDNVAAEFKRWMGQSDRKVFKAATKSLSAEDLSAEILKSLLEDARRQTTDPITASVITVPSAFGQLQCEATARSAALAGLTEAPLLQEPLAASIAYGMKLDAWDKRWLVYDLGGGTFDIALVSTRDGQLSVLEHRGDNMLGGKDFDRLIVERIFWPRLEDLFNMPGPDSDPAIRRKLIQILRGKAEEAKIDLSLSERVVVSIFDAGNDEDGNPIEAEFEITRAELNPLVEPLIAKTIELCKQALDKARITTKDISTIILVGGPTHMPILREMLTTEVSVPLDFTIDPMTVVARGAAIYASTLPCKQATLKPIKSEAINIKLAYETVWSETTCLVAGRMNNLPQNIDSIQISIEAETGHWNSGWLPVQKDYFETKVHLLEGRTNRFWIYLRDRKGNDLAPSPDSFSIRHGLTLAEPPLPHSIGAEVVRPDGKSEIDVIFPRSTPLPAQKIVPYKAYKKLRPSQTEDYLAIKIWEGESFSDPEANTFVGVLKIVSNEIRRPIPEGTDIEVSISINASRLMEVQAFVPVLNQHFQNRVYVPKENEEVIVEKAQEVEHELNEHYDRIENLEEVAQEIDDPTIQQEVNELKVKLDELTEERYRLESHNQSDPDDAKRVVQQSKEVRGRLSEIERRLKSQARLPLLLRNVEAKRARTEEVVKRWGDRLEQKEYELLCREANRQIEREDEKALEKVIRDFESLKWRVLFKQDWYWKELFDSLCQPGVPFINAQEAQRLITVGQEATARGDGDRLREIVRELWKLQPRSAVETEKEKALRAGIRRN
ncbi:MAG TPA: Hsp70 family protein [Thermodesulfobacteriota bacterium]|nr:Hsp70 family protein [Thermodesulfobacteriota bacterium]